MIRIKDKINKSRIQEGNINQEMVSKKNSNNNKAKMKIVKVKDP
jgi:C4-type Zn-finger protein